MPYKKTRKTSKAFRIDAKDILEKVDKRKTEKVKQSFYFDAKIYAEFKKSCGKRKCGLVLEELMKSFLSSFGENS